MEAFSKAENGKGVVTPTQSSERISILDSLRGIAILGILLMNVGGMGLPTASDPSVLNETGINYQSWYYVNWLADGTQRALFSILFGAGIILFVRNQEKKLNGIAPADLFFKRQLWLLVFGLINIYIFLWSGDILFDYACCGFIMFIFRSWSPKALITAAAFCMLIMIGRENQTLYQDKKLVHRGEQLALKDTSIAKLTILESEQLSAMNGFKERASIEAKKKRAEKAVIKMNSSYGWAYEYRTTRYLDSFLHYTYFSIWDVLQFMFLGMAFFKNGILTGKGNTRTYLLMCVIGLGVGIALGYFRVENFVASNYNWFNYAKQVNFESYNLDRTFRTIGIFGGVMLMYKAGVFKWFFNMMRAPGQMAFTNYLMQSLIALFLFTGAGAGLFGQWERHQLYLLVGGIWLFQIVASHVWLHFYRFGPFEWLWRSLTYWKLQPMKKGRDSTIYISKSEPVIHE